MCILEHPDGYREAGAKLVFIKWNWEFVIEELGCTSFYTLVTLKKPLQHDSKFGSFFLSLKKVRAVF